MDAPKAPRILVHEAFDGAIRVFEAPVEPGWGYLEEQREGEGFAVISLKYALPGPPFPLVLIAKSYALAYAPDDPAGLDWREAFAAVLPELDGCDVTPSRLTTMTSSLAAHEALLSGRNEDGVDVMIRERRAIHANEEFVITAMGPRPAFEAHRAVVDRWFDTIAVVPLSDTPD